MTSLPQHSIRLAGLAGLSLALALGACSSNSSSGKGTGGSPGGGGVVGSGGTTSTGGTVATGGSTATAATGGVLATGGSIQPSGGSTGGTSATGGSPTSGGSPATGGSTATGGSSATGGASGGTTATGGTTVSGGTTATGGASGGTTATGGASGGRTGGASGGAAGGSTATGGRTGGATGGNSGGNTGGTRPTGGTTGTGGATGGTTRTGGTTASGGSSGDGGVASDTSGFHCVNWADSRDNFQTGLLQLSGLSTSDDYATVKAKADSVLSQFQTLLQANSIRIPINEASVSNASWWAAYKGVFDSAIGKNMKVMVARWGPPGSGSGKVADVNLFYTMWQTVIDAYLASGLVYFDIMNEPSGYSPTAFIDFCAQWIAQFPTVPKNRIVVAGNYNDQDVNQQGADARLAGCLLSVHAYPNSSSTNTTTEQGWRDFIKAKVGPYYSRTILTEWTAAMSTGVDYSAPINGNVDIAYMTGVPNQLRDYKMGSCWWAGLETGNMYAIAKLTSTAGMNLTIAVTNASGLARLQAAWGL